MTSISAATGDACEDAQTRLRLEALDAMTAIGWRSAWFAATGVAFAVALVEARPRSGWFALWVVAIGIVLALRFAAYTKWRAQQGDARARAVPTFERLYRRCAGAEGVLWAVLVVFVPRADATLCFALGALALAVAFGGLLAYGQRGTGGVWYFAPILLPWAAGFALQADPLGRPMALFLIVFTVFAVLGQRALAKQRGVAQERRVQQAFTGEERSLLNTLTVGILVTRQGVVTDCNETLLKMFGYSRAELVGSRTDILLPDGVEEAPAGVAAAGPALRRHRDGTLIHVEMTSGRVEPEVADSLVVTVLDDVTEKLHFERELQLSRERLRLALDALQSGVWDVDVDEARYFFSRRFKTLLGYAVDAALKPPEARLFFHHQFVHPEDAALLADQRMAMLLKGDPLDAQYRVVRDGRVVWIRETALALPGQDGMPARFTGSITDTTSINEIQGRLAASEAFHRHLIEASNALIWRTDAQGILTFVNERGARELYGYAASEMIGRSAADFTAPEAKDAGILDLFRPLEHGVAVRNVESIHLTRSQRRLFVSINAVPVLDEQGRYAGVMGIATDITYLKRRERAFQDSTRLQRLIFDSAGEGIVLVRNQRIYRTNQAFADLLGVTLGELVARPLAHWFVDPEQWSTVESQLRRLGNVIKVEQQLKHSSGHTLWASVTGRSAELGETERYFIWVFADISASKAQQERSWHRANHDDLTGLANRRLLQDRLEQALAQARRERERAAILMLDLDGFKAVNDAYGHLAGDEVLRQVAQRLAAQVRALDTVARLGGDEFIILLHSVAAVDDAAQTARRVIEDVRRPVEFGANSVSVNASVGIAVFPDSADGLSALMQAADVAMYAAKANGKGRYEFAPPAPPATANTAL